MKLEMKSFDRNHTWSIVKALKSKRAYGLQMGLQKETKMMFTILSNPRVAANGYSQVEGIDFYEVFSLMVKQTLIVAIFASVVMEDMELH